MLIEPVSFEALLPLSLIRDHIADDDTERFSEAQLDLYREAAFEACELYTGLSLRPGLRQVEERIALPRGYSLRSCRDLETPSFHRLREPATTGIVAIVSNSGTQTLHIDAGGTRIPIWMLNETISFGAGACEFGRSAPNQMLVAVYMTGDERPKPLPAGIKLGVLKMIAWSVTNAGDTVVTVSGAMSASRETQLQYGTNNAAVASGAVDQWRQYARNLVR